MLNIYYGKMKEAIFNTSVYFKNVYEDSWITDPFAKEMILDIDKSTVLDSSVIDSPVLGKIAPIGLSGGVKTLILIYNEPHNIFNASTCGDNCAKWILKIAKKKDITVNLRHLMDFGDGEFDIIAIQIDRRTKEGDSAECRARRRTQAYCRMSRTTTQPCAQRDTELVRIFVWFAIILLIQIALYILWKN